MAMYSIYNSDTLEKLIDTLHKMHIKTTWNEKLLSSKLDNWCHWYLSNGVGHYTINYKFSFVYNHDERSMIYIWRVYQSIANVCQGDKNSLKYLFANISFATITIAGNSRWSQKAIQISNPDYDIVIKWWHLYYDMKLVTFGINEERNLIVWFPVFVQPYTQQQLIYCTKLKWYQSLL